MACLVKGFITNGKKIHVFVCEALGHQSKAYFLQKIKMKIKSVGVSWT